MGSVSSIHQKDVQPSGGDVSRSTADRASQEISHRVGSSLQTLTSHIRSIERQVADAGDVDRAVAGLQRARQAIMATAQVQRLLSYDRAGDDETQQLLQAMGDYLKTVYNKPDVAIHIEGSDPLPASVAHVTALILCELMTNALRHGFSSGQSGAITVSLRQDTGSKVILTVEDNGQGSPAPPLARPDHGLGLVQQFVEDADGSITGQHSLAGWNWAVELPVR